eukprot:TRINITY_DN30864_c0_g1_i1.p2 TRINITY_DN30864_c0_g1~~TRINITY_DN30864_c0_g1_i1.p2  ORF type:complete len:117 (+),score=4.31 TRINITY_DN30864_c0_g1_i1:368-718(+)
MHGDYWQHGGSFRRFDGRKMLRAGRVVGVVLHVGKFVDGVGLLYANGTEVAYGGLGGGVYEFSLDDDERITGMACEISRHLTALEFTTNKRSFGARNPLRRLVGGPRDVGVHVRQL